MASKAKAVTVKSVYWREDRKYIVVLCPSCGYEGQAGIWFTAHIGTCRMTGQCQNCGVYQSIPKKIVVGDGPA